MDHVGSVLPQSYQQLMSDALLVRRDDVRGALSDRLSSISHSTLTDFDWTTKASICCELISTNLLTYSKLTSDRLQCNFTICM